MPPWDLTGIGRCGSSCVYVCRTRFAKGLPMEVVSIIGWVGAIFLVTFALYNLFHYVLFLLATHPQDAGNIGHELNEFERRQLVEWAPRPADFLKHDDENRTYDDIFGAYRSELASYSTCVFPRTIFSAPYAADYCLLKPWDGMRLLDLGCGSGAAADYIASRSKVDITCVTNSPVQENICRRRFEKFGGRVRVMVADFDSLDLPDASFDAIYSLESIGYTKDIEAWLARYWRMLKPGGRLLIRSPGSLDFCRREKDYRNVTAFFNNWRYNFLGSNLLVYFMRRLGFEPIEIPAAAVRGLWFDLELHPASVLVEVQAAHALDGGPGKNHLAYVEDFRVRQRLQYRRRHQTGPSNGDPCIASRKRTGVGSRLILHAGPVHAGHARLSVQEAKPVYFCLATTQARRIRAVRIACRPTTGHKRTPTERPSMPTERKKIVASRL